jgi:hypothetical protein
MSVTVIDEINTEQEFFSWLKTEDGGSCAVVKKLPDNRYAAIKPLLFHWTLITGQIGDIIGYDDRWCYSDRRKAEAALHAWNGDGEPTGWHRHPATGRRRPQGDVRRQYIEH